MKIPRHKVWGLDVARERLDFCRERVPKVLASIPERLANLYGLSQYAWHLVLCTSVVEPGAPDLGWSLRIAAQASAALFMVRCADGGKARFPLGDRVVETSDRVDESTVNTEQWIHGFYLAALCRESALLDALCRTPADLFRQSSTTGPDFRRLVVDALRDFWTRATYASHRISAAVQAAAKTEREAPDLADWVRRAEIPALELLGCLQDRSDAFAETLVRALLLHKAGWSRTKERRGDWDGFLALWPLALAAIAYDRGIPFNVESEYLPMSIVRGDLLQRE